MKESGIVCNVDEQVKYWLCFRMTGVGGRPELIVEGSNFTDGGWMEYEFLYKPGDVYRRPPVVGKWGCGDKILYKDGNTVEGYHRVEL